MQRMEKAQQGNIIDNITGYKRKKLSHLLLGGILFSISILIITYLFFSTLEGIGHFGTIVRGGLFFLFIIFSTILFIRNIIIPMYYRLNAHRAISDEQAATDIGKYYPDVNDKLLNYIQLLRHEYQENSLTSASITQRSQTLSSFLFAEAVDYSPIRIKLNYLIPLFLLALGLTFAMPKLYLSSTERIVNFNKQYLPLAPFSFNIVSAKTAFRNEDYLLALELKGETIPKTAMLVLENRRITLSGQGVGKYSFLFPNIQSSKIITIEAAGFKSGNFLLTVVDRPSLTGFNVRFLYPDYLKMPPATLENIGSIEIPEGTKVEWNLTTEYTDQLRFNMLNQQFEASLEPAGIFSFDKTFLESTSYDLQLTNANGTQQGLMHYVIKVRKDELPGIQVNVLKDTLLYQFVALAGTITDDYGLRRLNLHYAKNNEEFSVMPITIDRSLKSQSFFYQWMLNSLNFSSGDKVAFYLEVSDNDGVNGSKSMKSGLYEFAYPDQKTIESEIDDSSNKTTSEVNKAELKARNLKKELDEISDRLKGKKELSWEDEKKIEQLIKDKDEINKQIESLQRQNKLLNEKQKQFLDQSESVQTKQDQLQQLMDELLDDETRQLYEELQQLLQDYQKTEPIQDVLDRIKNKEINLEQELSRAIELFKRLQIEQKLEETVQKLEELSEAQDSLANSTKQKDSSYDSLLKNQENLNKEFENIQKDIEDTKKLNQDLEHPSIMEKTSGDEEQIKSEQNNAIKSLEDHKRNKAENSQKGASQNMKSLSQKMQQMQSSMMMEQMQENIEDLQMILKNLIELSYNQEDVMKGFRTVKENDPRFISLSEEQLQLKDDARIVEDSLLALAKRVMVISSFVTRELNEMKRNMESSVEAIKGRKKPDALARQQLAMTSMNNLALMLDDVLQQMQQSMADAMGNSGKGKPQEIPSMSELQKQLNKEIRELRESGKTGRELSEELAKLAAEQERIRKALKDAEEKFGDKPGGEGDIRQQMEETEMDLVNKNLTRETINRQQQILTRLLEAEKSLRERELDTKREAKAARQYDKVLPEAFEEYLKQRNREVELLNTVPTKLLPYYKNEVNKYFERLKNKEQNELN